MRRMALWLQLQALEPGCLQGKGTLLLTCCATVAKGLHLPMPQFSHL